MGLICGPVSSGMADVTQPDGFNTHQAAGLWRGRQFDLLWRINWNVEWQALFNSLISNIHFFLWTLITLHCVGCSMNNLPFIRPSFLLYVSSLQAILNCAGWHILPSNVPLGFVLGCVKKKHLVFSLSALTLYCLQHEDLLKMCSLEINLSSQWAPKNTWILH